MAVDAETSIVAEAARRGQQRGLIELAAALVSWKSKSFAEQVGDKFFGRDGPYANPLVADGVHLQHVHLRPSRGGRELEKWDRARAQMRIPTSDRALVYISDQSSNYLIVGILADGTAHEVADMKTSDHQIVMHGFARVAAHWLANREVFSDWVNVIP